ncbi:alkane 1-monooxygenase [Streptomyces odontomachi]|uniref:alkane 1-monooxygenase n=1 Tax=Streptomyces odontomachi TaxID=2944940 RepID=UPI00210A7EED|nr:alkane 1-monooxygenase [Streptomyces sp. ODS25]
MTQTIGAGEEQVTWRDPKRYLWLLGLVIPLFPFICYGLVKVTGWSVMWLAGAATIYVLVPLLEPLIGKDDANPPQSVLAWLEADHYYRWCTYLYVPLQYAGLVFGCWVISSGDIAVGWRIVLAITCGGVAGIGINTAHELGHKKESVERWLSKINLAQTCYGHFFIEHNRGHHVRVATPDDPASARLGESFWRFWPRTVSGSLRSAWHLEKKRLARSGKGPWTIKNDVLNAWLMSVVLFAALAIAFGPGILPYLVAQAIFGFSLLEVINYTEHYGLGRERTPSGRYERCAPKHSWNSDNVVTNILLYHLQRHSDHHANPTRRYQALRNFDEAPELPTGYAGMILMAYFPPIWRRVMDKRVIDHYGGDVTRANIQPSKRDAILARYGHAA